MPVIEHMTDELASLRVKLNATDAVDVLLSYVIIESSAEAPLGPTIVTVDVPDEPELPRLVEVAVVVVPVPLEPEPVVVAVDVARVGS